MLREPTRRSSVTPATLPEGERVFLLQGAQVSLDFVRQPPVDWSEQSHTEIEVMVLFSPAVCRMRWQASSGEKRESLVRGPAISVLPAGVKHTPSWEREAERILVYLDPKLFKRYSGGPAALASFKEPLFSGADDAFIWSVFSSLRHLGNTATAPERCFVSALGTMLTGFLVSRLQVSAAAETAGTRLPRSKMGELFNYIDTNLGKNIRVADLARKAGLSVAHFAEVFKNTTGSSPYQYITRCRVLRAQELLATGEHRISDVVEETGFCDQSHLNRHFKRVLGFSPKEVLARARKVPRSSPKNPVNIPKP